MSLTAFEGLRQQNWQKSSPLLRIAELQNLENSLAEIDERTPCTVNLIPPEAYQSPQDHEALQGYHNEKGIFVNEELINNEKPYMAVETLFHESRHDYQESLANQQAFSQKPEEVSDFRKNLRGGYLSNEKDGYLPYRWQPVEKDANEVARQRTDELYLEKFGEDPFYQDHRTRMEENISKDIEFGKLYWGDDFTEEARKRMLERYDEVTRNETNELAAVGPAQDGNPVPSASGIGNMEFEGTNTQTPESPPEEPPIEEIKSDASSYTESAESQSTYNRSSNQADNYDYSYGQ
jgi:hypothetical protein